MIPKRFHTAMALGDKRHMTPEGFLVCMDVPMARTGEMLYGPDETPITTDGSGVTRIVRDETEVFAPNTVLSMIGKPVTNDHPEDMITPGTWRQHAVGTVISARRGEGTDNDLLMGDIMITDARAIQSVLEGKIEVSAGYDSEYDELGPGRGRQKNIYYNHLALVEKGRCGSRCAIGDYQPPELRTQPEKTEMKKHKRGSMISTSIAALRAAFATNDAAEIEKRLKETETAANDEIGLGEEVTAGNGEIHIHVGGPTQSPKATSTPMGGEGKTPKVTGLLGTGDDDPTLQDPNSGQQPVDPVVAMNARMDGLEAAVKQIAVAVQKLAAGEQKEEEEAGAEEMAAEAPPNTDVKTVKDSAVFADSFRDTAAMAEVITPGIRIPAFDATSKPKKTIDALCSFRRTVLDLAFAQPATRGMIDDLSGGKTLDTKCMTCDAVRTMFRSLHSLRRAANNGGARDAGPQKTTVGGAVEMKGAPRTMAEYNARAAARRAARAVA